MKKLKNIIIMLIILIVIISIIIMIITKMKTKNNNENILNIDTKGDIGDEPEKTGKEEIVTDATEIVTIKNCISRYYDIKNSNSSLYYGRNENGEFEKISTEEEINNNILDLLSKEYISRNNINEANLNRYIDKLNEKVTILILDIRVLVDNPVSKYVVYGKAINDSYEEIEEFYLFVNIDIKNKTFSIEPIKDKKNINEIKIINNNELIFNNDNNYFEQVDMSYKEIIINTINQYKVMMISNSKSAYKYLDNEYREKRFQNIDNFEKYVENNKENISLINISKYMVNYYDDYTEFICIDRNNNYYIIKEKSIIDFSIMLDAYTIEQQDTIEKYDKSNDQDKVAMNIDKIRQALNTKDYEYIFNKLDNTFKQNNFESLEEFKTYITDNLFEINNIIYNNISKEGNLYMCETNIKASDDEQEDSRNVTFIMELLEDRNFVMSFSIE